MSRLILLVDDDPSIRELGAAVLSHVAGWEVALAGSGAEALEVARQRRPDLILLDLMMPDMDGYETLRELRSSAATADLPVALLTAAHDDELDQPATRGVALIRKPFDPMTLPEQVRRLITEAGG